MSKQPKVEHPCPECGGTMVYETRPDTIKYKDQERAIEMLAWWCTECNEAIFEGQPLAEREKVFLELKAEVDEVLSPAEVAAARAKLGLSQRKASELLGGGPRAFQKYEAGTQAVSAPMSNLLRLLANDPSRLAELTAPPMTVPRMTVPRMTTVARMPNPNATSAKKSQKTARKSRTSA